MRDFILGYWFLVLMLVIASIVTYTWLYIINKHKLNMKWWEALILTVIHTVYGVFTVVFFAKLEQGFDFEKAGNMSLYGGIFFMPLMYIIYSRIKKISLSLTFDIFAIPLAATLLLARFNCIYAGCCIGKYIQRDSGPRYPTRLMDILVHLSFLVFAIPWVYKNKSKGRAYPLYMIIYGAGRFVIEWFRESDVDQLFHIGHIWSLVSLTLGIGFLLYFFIKEKIKNKKNIENNQLGCR